MAGQGTTAGETPTPSSPLTALVRALLVVFCGLTAAGFGALFVLATATDRYFAWTIEPPATAAFLGSGYGAGLVLSALALRSGDWRQVRVPFLTITVFTWCTTAATLVHRDRLHDVSPGTGPVAEPAAWVWLVVYLVVPVAMVVALPRQVRVSGRAESVAQVPPRVPLPIALRALLAVQGLAMGVVGVALLLAPASTASWWPWALSPFTARVVGAWLVAFALAAALSIAAADLAVLRISTIAYTLFGALQLVTLLRFPDDVAWDRPQAWLYLALLLSIIATGAAGSALAARRRRPSSSPSAAGRRPEAH